MTTFTPDGMRSEGFVGFQPVRSLRRHVNDAVPDEQGIYVLCRPDRRARAFLQVSTGGWYQGRDPSVSIERLESEWLAHEDVVYIGKAESLRERLAIYLRFGAGEDVFHYGGRLIWHLAYSDDLIVAWRETEAPRAEERRLLLEFKARAGRYPFANLRG